MVFDNTPSDHLVHNMQTYQEYMKALESERTKIQVFERELPLCLSLITQAIEGCRRQLSGQTTDYLNGQSDCSEQTSSHGPVLEQFIPIKRHNNEDNDDDDEDGQEYQELINNNNNNNNDNNNNNISKKTDWLRSAQLSIQSPDPVLGVSPKVVSVVEVKRNGCGAFHPFKKEKCSGEAPASVPAKVLATPTVETMADTSSTAETGGSGAGGGSKSEDKGQTNQKARRNWSPELHRRFLNALQELGGAHVATPKQIRESMMVDGLTNDEVKSHLQKYRLHTRRPSPPNHNSQTPQFVVVGGLWMPPPEYTAAMATNSNPNSRDTSKSKGVYAPVASHPPSKVNASLSTNKTNSCEKDDGSSHANSPSTSSSTHTTTASPVF